MAGPVDGIAEAQRLLLELGPRRGYFPEPDKSILIVPLATPPTALESLAEFNFRHEEGHRYLGGFVGSGAAEAAWVDPQVQQWIEGVHCLAAAARRYPQTAYAGLSQSLQSEWQYLQRVTPDIAPAFAPLEAAIATVFLPALLDASVEEVAKLRPLLALPTRLGGLGIPDPTTTGAFCYAASTASTNLLHCSLVEGAPLCAAAHRRDASTGRLAAKAHQRHATEGRLAAILDGSRPMEKRRIIRSAATGAWLSTRPSLLNGSDLSAEEFRDGVRLRLGLTPTSLPPRCDGCGERFTTEHAMSCRKGGLILHRHNDLVATWGQLCGQAHTPSTVSDEPLIQTSQDAQAAGANRTEPTPELRGDIAVHGFWTRGTTAIFDVRVTDTDAPRIATPPGEGPASREGEESQIRRLCIARRRTFTPRLLSGRHARRGGHRAWRLASSLASKWRRSYSEVCGFVRSRLAIALVRSASRCLRADRNPMRRTLPDLGLRSGPRPLSHVTDVPFALAPLPLPNDAFSRCRQVKPTRALCSVMSVNGAARGNARGTTANRAVTAVIDGVGHRRLMLPTARQEIQNSSTRSALVPSGTARERPSSVRRQLLASDESLQNDDDGSTREPPLRRQRQVLQRCCDCSRSSTCALARPTARSQACPCRVANKRCTSCSCFNNCQNKRAPLPPPTTATLRCFFTSPAQLRPQSPPQQSNPPSSCRSDRDRDPPAPSPTTRQQTATTDVDGDVGMTPSHWIGPRSDA
ncbi:hypothetical protein MHU86_15687 [Fragilaria crotonensis]|nr:hypothetical protein MHU86_15687 [Fragilaria crotonensis]